MKFKSLLLAAAVAAVSMSGAANAAIDGPVANGNSENSDFVFYIYDKVNDLSYLQNLDVNYKNIILPTAGSFSGSFNLDASKLSIFSASNAANLVWGLAATGLDFLDPDGSTLGFVGTRVFPAGQDLTAIGEMNLKFTDLAKEVNLFTPIGTANALSANGAASSKLSAAVKAFSIYEQAASVNLSQNLWFNHTDAAYDVAPAELASANPWILNLTTNTVSSAGTVAPVPLPAAAWLMFSALMGLGGIARRRNAKV
jgi:hypothetical protein